VRHDLAAERFALPFVSLGQRRSVNLHEYEDQGQRVVSVDNGWMRLLVAPACAGAAIALEQGGVNHLLSSFPTPRSFVWLNPWHGGISPVLLPLDDEWVGPGNTGRMWKEEWRYALIPPRRRATVSWAGVRVASDLGRDKLRGLRLEMDYLTAGGSNVLAVVARLVNTTTAPFGGMLMTQAYLQVGGERGKTVLHHLGQRRLLRVRDHEWGAFCGSWAGVENVETGQCMAMVAAQPGGDILLMDFGLDGPHLFNTTRLAIAPLDTVEMTMYLVLAPDVAQARLYRCLEHWSWQSE